MEQTEEEEDISNGSCSIGTHVSIPKTKKNVGTVIRYKNQPTSTRKYSRSFGTQTSKREGITTATQIIDFNNQSNKPELSNRATQTDTAGDRETIVQNFNFDASFQSLSYYPEHGYSDTSFNIESYEEESDDSESVNETVTMQEATVTPRNGQVFFVSWSVLERLLIFCLKCKAPAFIIKSSIKGSVLIVTLHCVKDHVTTWRSQSTLNHVYECTLRLSARILFSGFTFQRIKEVFDFADVVFIGKTQYSNIQKRYLFSAVYCDQQNSILENLRVHDDGNELISDGRFDSLGYSAKYGTYTLMDSLTKKAVTFFIAHARNA